MEENHILERLNNLVDSFDNDVVVFLVIRKRKKTKQIIASKLLRDFNASLEPAEEYIG